MKHPQNDQIETNRKKKDPYRFMKLKELFSDEQCNMGRQTEIDLSKTGMILELILCHCFIECSSDERLLHGLPFVMDSVIGGPLGAPGFMVAMGIGMIYTRHNSPRDYLKRGSMLFIYSFLLNICRFTIPFLIGYAITGNYDKYMSDIVYLTFENDILMFAALAFMLMALLTKLKTPPWLILATGFAMSGIATLLNGVDFGNDAANIIAGHFIGTEDPEGRVCSYFTLFNWFVVPAFGYFYGYYYSRLKDKKRFHLIFAVPALILTVIYLYIGITQRTGVFGEGQLCYYHISTYDILGALCAAVARLGLFYALSLVVPDFIKSFAKASGQNVTCVYCIQWVLIVVITNLVIYIPRGTQELNDGQTLLLAVGVTVVSLVLAYYYKIFKTNRLMKHEEKNNTDK